MGSPSLKRKASTLHRCEEASRPALKLLSWMRNRCLGWEKMERNDEAVMSWERAARSNCHAERDGRCSVR